MGRGWGVLYLFCLLASLFLEGKMFAVGRGEALYHGVQDRDCILKLCHETLVAWNVLALD